MVFHRFDDSQGNGAISRLHMNQSRPLQSGVGTMVVTFFPDQTILGKLVASLLPKNSAVMIIDNTPSGHLPVHYAAPAGRTLLRPGENLGISTDLNKLLHPDHTANQEEFTRP